MTASNKGPFTGRVAFVTGAANGIGRAAALAFAREGASVVVADVSEQGSQETVRLLEEQSGRALAVWSSTAAKRCSDVSQVRRYFAERTEGEDRASRHRQALAW